ncbi:MAG: hypothetical protein AVDCRST_MAG39-1202 [uncultured Sphingomonadaceae bacterium]|uniref:Uncharacterized protein n=1 Tax=uncultured Sphingomonadaceae bacterium TaxID=169976 RepID=A0A6J4SP72_9SPHN|nr:MAG: hypothetical protein AVDCRST_MAG39-1202 [uncultured Sphingomonadaceae bacterium]
MLLFIGSCTASNKIKEKFHQSKMKLSFPVRRGIIVPERHANATRGSG